MIIDDDPIVVDAIAMIAQSGGHAIIGLGYSAKEALALYQQESPDLVLLDIRMQDGSGIDAAKAILQVNTMAKILLVTTFEDKEYIQQALSLGCKGYLLKQHIKSILPAIDAVLSGQTVLDDKVIQSVNQPTYPGTRQPDLTDREQAIYELVAQGLNNKEIASKLYLGEGTVRNYISQLLQKIGVRDRTQLAISYYHTHQERN